MVVGEAIHNIMGGIENTGTIKQHSHKKKLRQRFDIIKKLGQGTFGKVQLGINKETGQEVAIKTIKKSKIDSEADLVRIRREIQIMSSVQHPNIIHIYEVFENREKMVLVMEYAAGGELYDYLSERKVLDEEEARRIFRQIATACYYCHKHKICHRDLKLENILLDENNNAKIADFGLSNVFDEQRLLNTFCGSPLYASPEIVKGTPYHGPEVDCWSLGVLLYTLVYGAMPFDGSNFKRLVKQISQGDYFEPAKPSPASPLIRDMLTVNPKHRADIEKICSHWWVNEGYGDSCLEISEELANQTPVRLDVLLSLAPPPPQLESEKLMLTGEERAETIGRSQSVGSLMELAHPMDMLSEDKTATKRKLESTVSTDKANVDKRKEKIVKENTVADITTKEEPMPLDRSSTQTLSKEMDVETVVDPCLQGAVCSELIEESEKKKQQQQQQQQQQAKVKRTLSTSVSGKILEEINENPSQENLNLSGKENVKEEPPKEEKQPKKSPVKKKVLKDKNDNNSASPKPPAQEEKKTTTTTTTASAPKEEKPPEPEQPVKPIERRKSRIFEAAEKFQNLIKNDDTKPTPIEKPKKIIIPGVSVDGFKREFERKASLTSTSPPKPNGALAKREEETVTTATTPKEEKPATTTTTTETNKTDEEDDTMKERVRNAVSIISSALDKEGARKSKSRPCMVRKPPVPFGVSGRSASGNIGMVSGPKPFVKPETPEEPPKVEVKAEGLEATEEAKAADPSKSATLPRRKTLRAEITLNYPMPKPTNMIIKTEFGHETEGGETRPTMRGEIIVPLGPGFRPKPVAEQPQPATEQPVKSAPSRERIIPISFEAEEKPQERVQSPPAKPPVPKPFQTQQSNSSQGSNLSRQSTQESDTETQTSTGEPIKKSPREYIIPIAVEGGGYVTPRAGSLEPSETSTSTMTSRSKSKFGRGSRRLNSFFSDRDSEDESSPFSSLHRRGSIGKDSDNEDSKRDIFHMHRLRSTRPKKSHLEHNDSLSSGEDNDDEGFEILTAENLFSTLLSRVRDLTQRLNVDDGVRPGFPNSRLLSHFDRGSNFWNRMDHPLSRHSSLGRTLSGDRPTVTKTSTGSSFGVPWRRTISRDTSAEGATTSPSPQRPIGDMTQEENLNLADLNLKKLKLSDEDALALSYLTPGLSRRIQQQLLAQLAPREARKLHRTMSSRIPEEREQEERPATSTLPRNLRAPRSFLPVKRDDARPSYDFAVRSSSIGAEPRGDSRFLHLRPKAAHAKSPDPDGYSGAASRPYSKYSKGVEPENRFKTLEPENRFKTLEPDRPSKRISRFLRPDFFDAPKEDNVYLKEKKEREMETQKVLKEIRDKRRSRLRRERSQSKEKQAETSTEENRDRSKYSDDDGSRRSENAGGGLEYNGDSKGNLEDSSSIKWRPLEPTKTKHLEDSSRLNNTKYLDGGLEQNKSSLRDSLEQIKAKHLGQNSLEQNKSKRYEETKGSLVDNSRQNNLKYLDGSLEQIKLKSSKVSLDEGKTDRSDSIRQNDPICLEQSKSKHVEDNNTKHLEDNLRQKYSYGNLEQSKSKRIEDRSEQNKVEQISLGNNKEGSPKERSEQNKANRSEDGSSAQLEHNSESPSKDNLEVNLRYLEQNKSKRLKESKLNPPKDSSEQDRTKHLEVGLRESKLSPSKESSDQDRTKHLEIGLRESKLSPSKESSEQDRTKYLEISLRQGNVSSEQNKSKHLKDSLENSLEYNKERQKRRQQENCPDRAKKEEKLHSYVNVPGSKAVHDYVNVKAAPKTSKIARPKSYPIDNVERPTKSSPDKESKISRLRKGFTSKQSKEKTNETNKSINEEEKQQHKNKLLHSIEKKLEKLRSGKDTDEKSGCGVENAIKRLREQSLPRNIEPCTESGLIKRAVSVEDLTGSKPLQTSRKSVTKILGLFKKYEEQDNNNKKKTVKKVKSKDKVVINNNNNNNDASESSQSERSERRERPRSLFFEKAKDNCDSTRTMKSKLPVNSHRRSLNLEPNGNDEERPSRRDLRLELGRAGEDRNSLTADDSSTATLLSPSEDYMSCDSWSVCSDLHSPLSPNGNVGGAVYSGDEGESVIDRIRRKSFYTRFNEKRRSRRPVSSSFRELDAYRRGGGAAPQEPRAYGRPYARAGSSSLLNDYINVPDHYQPYGARAARAPPGAAARSEEDALDELISNAKAKKYSSQIQPTRLGRTSGTTVNDYYMPRSPSSEPI